MMMMMITLPCIVPITIKLYSLILFSYICVEFKFLKLMVHLKLWIEIFQNPVKDKYSSKFKPVGSAMVILLLNTGCFKAYNIQEFLDMK